MCIRNTNDCHVGGIEFQTPDGPLNHLFDSCLIYCSQVAISVNIRADDVVFNMGVYKMFVDNYCKKRKS